MAKRSVQQFSPDVLSRICDHCDRSTLVQLARTCRAFSIPSFRRIWQTLDGFAPLFETLPEDALHYYTESLRSWTRVTPMPLSLNLTVLDINRELTATDLLRFRIYAPLVRHICWKPSFKPKTVSPHAWHVLDRANPGPLRNLRFLVYRELQVPDPTRSSPFHSLLGPNLIALRVSLTRAPPNSYRASASEGVDPTLIDFLVALPRTCPFLRILEVSVSPPMSRAQRALADAVCLLPHLTTFSASGIPLLPRAFCHLSTLPDLKTASWEDYYTGAGPFTPHHVRPFPSLETLAISANTVERALALLAVASPPRLVHLTLTLRPAPDPAQFASLAHALASIPFRPTLELLHIKFRSRHAPKPEPIPPSAFSPLFSLSRLRDIRIDGHCFVALNDHALAEMARAWPQLRVAHLYEDHSWTAPDAPETLPTLPGLVEVSRRCPDIEQLFIMMRDVRRDDVEAVLALPPPRVVDASTLAAVSPCALASLGVGRAAVEEDDVAPLAAALSLLFRPSGR
ncbi:hypothetical protein OH77DRAFT_811375 [Trametes cingulata]|nr:hypothetical protein OH77DRAFT_811375 [Trametes cingulata]